MSEQETSPSRASSHNYPPTAEQQYPHAARQSGEGCCGSSEPQSPQGKPGGDPCSDTNPPKQGPSTSACPEPKPYPEPPTQPADPCVGEKPKDGGAEQGKVEDSSGSQQGPIKPAELLDALREKLEIGQRELQKFEPLKTSMADVVQRIQALQKIVDGQSAANTAYRDFYHTVEVFRSEVLCFIPTVRCQLALTEHQKTKIREVIDAMDGKVKKAQGDRDAQQAQAVDAEKRLSGAERNLAWAKKWYEFFKAGLQQQVGKHRDDLKALKQLSDPTKDQCAVWFYLYEMERMLKTDRAKDASDACYTEDLNIATFLDCWAPDWYEKAYNHWLVAFNDAENAEKVARSELAEARKHAADLAKIAKEAEDKRREWILKEIKATAICGANGNPVGTA